MEEGGGRSQCARGWPWRDEDRRRGERAATRQPGAANGDRTTDASLTATCGRGERAATRQAGAANGDRTTDASLTAARARCLADSECGDQGGVRAGGYAWVGEKN